MPRSSPSNEPSNSPAERVDCRWQQVKCSDCGKEYQCTPNEDYFNSTTLTDGLCWSCFLTFNDMPAQPEPPYKSI